MSTPGDEMEVSGGKERKKLIHTVGCVSKVQLTSNGEHPFTGAFSKGTDTAMLRISMAAKPDPKTKNTIPGMGLKFFRDGIDSASMVAMYGVEGQDTWNIFANDWSNHIAESTELPLEILATHFLTVSDYP